MGSNLNHYDQAVRIFGYEAACALLEAVHLFVPSLRFEQFIDRIEHKHRSSSCR